MRAAWLILIAFAVAAFALPDRAGAQDPVAATITGPTAVAPSSTHPYEITVTGGPAADGGTFEINYALQGDNIRGGDPQIPRTLANREGRFTVNVTLPEVEGTVQLFVRAKSSNETANTTTETRLSIDVFRPIELRAFIRNHGAAAALNVTVFFYVDGRGVGNMTIGRIEAGGQAEANVTYIPVDLTPGRHALKVTADLDGDGTIEPAAGELLQSDFFYKTERSSVPAVLGTITVFILVVLVFVLLAIRRQRREQ